MLKVIKKQKKTGQDIWIWNFKRTKVKSIKIIVLIYHRKQIKLMRLEKIFLNQMMILIKKLKIQLENVPRIN